MPIVIRNEDKGETQVVRAAEDVTFSAGTPKSKGALSPICSVAVPADEPSGPFIAEEQI
jgi:hypothetical protein